MKMPPDLQKKYFNSLKTKVEKPCDGFELVKSSKWSIILSPLCALCGWLILLYLIAKR